MADSGDTLRIDAHKLHLHPQRVADWLDGKDIAPLYMEISPSGSCNHRCRFCGYDYLGYKSRFLPTERMLDVFAELGAAGVRSLMFAGEGEPLLHPDMGRLSIAAKHSGLDVAFTTNAVRLSADVARDILPVSTWIKVSCNGGSPATYAAVHGTRREDFAAVMHNLEQAVALREQLGSPCTLGLQMVLLPENQHEAHALARQAREMGLDYFVAKPFSQATLSRNTRYADLHYDDSAALAEQLQELNTPTFSSIFRHNTVQRWNQRQKTYDRCLALPFWAYMDAGGDVWGCGVNVGNPQFAYGNVLQQSFADIWHGPRRKESLAWCDAHLDARQCRINCRMDAINAYLWELQHPSPHHTFI